MSLSIFHNRDMNYYDTNPYELLYYARCGCEWAVDWLVISYRQLLHSIVTETCCGMPGMDVNHDDLYIEAMMGLYDAMRTYRDDCNASFYTFVTIVAKRAVLNRARHYLLYQDFQKDSFVVSLDMPVARTSILSDVVHKDNSMGDPLYCLHLQNTVDALDRAALRLSEKERRVLYHWIQGSTYKDAANRLGCSEKSYDGYMQRVRRKVYKTLFENGYKPLKSPQNAALH